MRVLIAVHHFPPNYTGGAELRALRTAQHLLRQGLEVLVVAVQDPHAGASTGVRVVNDVYEGVPVKRLFFNYDLFPDKARFEYDNSWVGDALDGIIADWQPDIFHLIGGYLLTGQAVRAARRAGLPVCLSATDFWWFCGRINRVKSDGSLCPFPSDSLRCARCRGEERRRYRIPGRLAPGLMARFWQSNARARQVYARCKDFLNETLAEVERIICPSNYLRQLFIQAGMPAERVIYSRQGRDFPLLTSEQLHKSPCDHLRAGYAGQIAWHKGIHLIGEALAAIPATPITVEIYGNTAAFPNYTSQLENIARADQRFRLRGVYSDCQALWQVYRDMDVLVVPSIWYENSPNVIIEAFAHHTPVITSNQGGMAEMVRDGIDGLHFEHGSAASLARQLDRLANDPAFLAQLQNGIRPVKSVAEEMDELIEIYQKLSLKGIVN